MKVLVATLLAAASTTAAAMPDELVEAFARMPEVDRSHWAFTEVIDNGDNVFRQRHDPRTENIWTLLSVDGETPTDDDLAAFDERIERRLSNQSDEPGDNDFSSLAEPESWALVDETADRARYTFRPRKSDNDMGRYAEHLDGELTLDRRRGVVEAFAIRSREPFRVRLVASIRFLETVISMQPIGNGRYFPATIETTVRGKAFGMKSIDRSVSIRYVDFEHIGDSETGATAD